MAQYTLGNYFILHMNYKSTIILKDKWGQETCLLLTYKIHALIEMFSKKHETI